MIASYGEQLLDWLENYTFPEEKRFKNPVYAHKVAKLFLDELASNGTTTALVFGTVHKESVNVFFEEAEKRNLRMIAGKVLMDRNAPDYLTDTPESGYAESKELIEKVAQPQTFALRRDTSLCPNQYTRATCYCR